jgi:hypothetical protein
MRASGVFAQYFMACSPQHLLKLRIPHKLPFLGSLFYYYSILNSAAALGREITINIRMTVSCNVRHPGTYLNSEVKHIAILHFWVTAQITSMPGAVRRCIFRPVSA